MALSINIVGTVTAKIRLKLQNSFQAID